MTGRTPPLRLLQILVVGTCISAVVGTTSGCLERLFPQNVAEGASRLTIRQAGTLLAAINADDACGFASELVVAGGKASAPPGSIGTYTTEVRDCVLDFGVKTALGEDCTGTESLASGRVTISGTRSVAGIITGLDAGDPVIPQASTAATIRLHIAFDNFNVTSPDGNSLTNYSGTLSFAATPLLAVSNENPTICSVATSKVSFSSVRYEDARMHLDAEGQSFDIDVATSDLTAFAGQFNDTENTLSGSMSVWGSNVVLSADLPLDPDYDRERFNRTWQCDREDATATFVEPINHECVGVGPLVASGASRLSVQNFAMVASLLEADTNCGFSARSVIEAVETDAPSGGEGTATYVVNDCTMAFPEDTVVTTDCNGNKTLASGTVTVTGTKSLTGRLTGALETPAIPLTDSPATITLSDISFDHFRVTSTGRNQHLTQRSGHMSGTLIPRTAVGASTGACSVTTPMVRIEDLSYTDADVLVTSPSGNFAATINASNFRAVNGSWNGETNHIGGTLTVNDIDYNIADLPDDNRLNTSYDAVAFDAAWQCAADVRLPVSHQCDFEPVLAQGAAQLTVSLFGQVMSALEADTTCGFASPAAVDGIVVDGELGRRGGSATYTVADCTLDFGNGASTSEDCLGNATELRGRVTVSATKTLQGIVSGDPAEPIIPETWEPAAFNATMAFESFSERSSSRAQYLTVRSGTLTGSMTPRTALDVDTGACSIPTSAVAMEELKWTNADAAIFASGTVIDLDITASQLLAQNGSGKLGENRLEGFIRLGAREFSIPTDPAAPGLDPSYDANAFVDSFSCAEGFELPNVVSDCDFTKTIAEGAARLVIQTMGEVAGRTNADTGCGFSNTLTVRRNPLEVVGEVGEMGSMLFGIEECELAGEGAETPSNIDCAGKETFTRGAFSSSGTLEVTGLRETITVFVITADSIAPQERESVTLTIDNATVTEEFQTWGVGPNGEEDLGELVVHSGSFSGTVRPIMGFSVAEDRYVAPTPVAALEGINLETADITMRAQGKTFRFSIDRTDLNAFNGSFGGNSNEISGSITIDGAEFVLGSQSLVPDFDQGAFDGAYACRTDDDLREIIPAN